VGRVGGKLGFVLCGAAGEAIALLASSVMHRKELNRWSLVDCVPAAACNAVIGADAV
jgi:hypothetical protein